MDEEVVLELLFWEMRYGRGAVAWGLEFGAI